MKASRTTILGVALSAVLIAVVAISVYSLQHALPEPLSVVLLPGFVLNLAFTGGAEQWVARDATAFLNIVVWFLVLGTAAALWANPKRSRATIKFEASEALVPIFVSHNPAELPVVESLLTEAGIQFMVKGEQIQGMFGGGQFGGTNLIVPLELCVLASDAEAARALLKAGAPGLPEESAT